MIDVRPWVPVALRPVSDRRRKNHNPTIAHYQAGARRLAQLPLDTFLLVRSMGDPLRWVSAIQICSGRARLVEQRVGENGVLTLFWGNFFAGWAHPPINISASARMYHLIIQPGQPGFDEMWAFRAACSARCNNETLLRRAVEVATK